MSSSRSSGSILITCWRCCDRRSAFSTTVSWRWWTLAEQLTAIQPPERRADAVLVLRRPGLSQPVRALVVEVQLRRDARKRLSWLEYVAVLRGRFGCPVSLVVLTLDLAIARWCAEPIEIDGHGSQLRPQVIGPGQVPVIDVDTARSRPALAVLSMLAHRGEPIALDLARAVLTACDLLDDDHATLYADLVLASLGDAARHALEAEMNLKNWEPISPYFRNLVARSIAEGLAQGVAQGVAEGRVEALARALLRVLEARGLEVTAEHRAEIASCSDAETLDAWLVQAVTAASAETLFGG